MQKGDRVICTKRFYKSETGPDGKRNTSAVDTYETEAVLEGVSGNRARVWVKTPLGTELRKVSLSSIRKKEEA